MALINCPECSKEISDKVKACPHCGYPFYEETTKSSKKKNKEFLVIIITLVVIALSASYFIYNRNQNMKAMAELELLRQQELLEQKEEYIFDSACLIRLISKDVNFYSTFCEELIKSIDSSDNSEEMYSFMASKHNGDMSSKILLTVADDDVETIELLIEMLSTPPEEYVDLHYEITQYYDIRNKMMLELEQMPKFYAEYKPMTEFLIKEGKDSYESIYEQFPELNDVIIPNDDSIKKHYLYLN